MVRIFFFIIAFLAAGIFFLQNSQSYDDKTTHPALTDEIVDFYNASFPNKLTAEEKEWIVQGAIDEDLPPRWVNHFYDPINNEGWKSEDLGWLSSATLQLISRLFFNSNTEIVSSKQWARDEALQLRYSNYGGNNTWDNALRQYAKGNKKEAYYILGHILHLLEDATVPDHTRNDTHAHEGSSVSEDGGSPYEDYGKNFNRQNLTTAQDLLKAGKRPVLLASIDQYFDELAKYSNGYFFSEDTINKKYNDPKITREDRNYGYGKDNIGNEFVLTEIKLITKENFDTEKVYTLKNSNVLSSYFSRLTQEAVMNGAGAVKLFHNEAEKIMTGKMQLSDEPQLSWWQAEMRSPLYGGIAIYNDVKYAANQAYTFSKDIAVTAYEAAKDAATTVYNTAYDTVVAVKDSAKQATATTGSFFGKIFSVPLSFLSASVVSIPSAQPVTQPIISQVTSQQPADVAPQIVIGVAPPISPPPSAQIPSVSVSLPQSASTSPTIIPAPTNNILPPDSNSWEKATSTTPVAEFAAVATTTTATTTISAIPSYQGGGYVSGVSSMDALLAANTAAQTEQQLLPPDSDSWGEGTSTNATLLIISDVNATGTTATSTIIVWTTNESADSQVEYGTTTAYGIFSALDGATTTTHQVVLSDLSASTTYHYMSTSRDAAGHLATSTDSEFTTLALPVEATSTEQIIATTTASTLPDILPGYHPAPVVINEVAWMGTVAAPDDEWIELYNKTSQPIDLTGWTLENGKQSLKINLEGMIQPRSYYLLERTASTTTDQEEDMVYTGAMPNSGQGVANLYLKNASSSIIDHIHQWYAGDNNSKNTMERVSPYVRGETPSNWGTYISSTSTPPFAKDADGNDIFGTPGAKNSVSTYTPVIDQISQNITWYKELSPYYAIYKIGVAREAVLTIQPGVTAKFTNGTGLEISGALQAEGVESDPIIFTSNSQTPKPGDWLNIIFSNPNQTSKLKYAQIQYGGQGINYNPNSSTPTYTGAVGIINSSPIIANSTFDNNQSIAIYIAGNSNPKITGNIIKNTDSYTYKNGPLNGFGIQLADGGATAEISNNTIESNSIGIKSASASSTPLIIKDNIFSNNGVNGEFSTNTFLNLDNSGNQDQNKQSGFVLKLNLISNQTSTLKKDILPYIISEYLVISASSTLVIEPGAVLKNSMGYYGDSYWRVYGVLKAKGTLDQPIIFTSASDDIDGYNQGGQPKPGEWNRLYFNGDIASQSEADYAFFRYGGRICIICTREGYCRYSDGAVLIENSSPTITNSTFEFNNQPDMKIRGVSSPTLENNTIGQIVRE